MNNSVKPLFSDHYLTRRIPSTSEWQENIADKFQYLQKFYQQKQDILGNLNESQTENEWIQPILEKLGFSYIVQTSLHKSGKIQRPDYSLFLDENTKQTAYNLSYDEVAFYSKAVVIADAKYWERNLSERFKNDGKDTFKNSNPSFQIVNYLDGTRVSWGILTNGRFWRLYSRLTSSPIQQFYQVDLVKILLENDLEKFKYFWLFFRQEAFIKDSQNRNFLERVREESNSYARQIEDQLKRLVFNQIFANLAGGFVSFLPSPPTPLPQERGVSDSLPPRERAGVRANLVYQSTLSFLYKILFLLYAESKNLLPIERSSYREYSLSLLVKNIADKCDKKQSFSETSTQYYDRLLSLFRIIDKGDRSLNVPAYNGGLFKLTPPNPTFDLTPPNPPFKGGEVGGFLLQYKLTDNILAPVLDQLARINGEFIDYKFLGVRDLGSIYEGLLEYKLIIDEVVSGKVHLENDKGERKETGSYYTPEYIVNYIVQHTLDPILKEREKQFSELMAQITTLLKQLQDSKKSAKTIQLLGQDLAKLQQKAYNCLLDIKVCDPAMGSGHFLVNTVDYITRKLINIINNYPENNPILEQLDRLKDEIINNLTKQGFHVRENSLSHDNLLHRLVMKRCIYGVDLNPMAVELAKVSLWLHSFTVGAPLSFLDHHLRCGNSLVGCMAKDVQNEFISADETQGFLPLFKTPFHGLLQSANVMQEIANLSDVTCEEVEQSQHYFNSFDQEAKQYKRLLDVYICQYFGLTKNEVTNFFRFRLNDLSGQPNKTDEKLLETARNLYQEKHFFHWDLEFPEVFIDLANAEWKENGGFDVVLGNPPYSVSINNDECQYLSANFPLTGKGYKNLALHFIELGFNLSKGLFSLIVPKSLTYSEGWKSGIDLLWNSLTCVADMGKAWSNVSLEMVIFIANKLNDSNFYQTIDLIENKSLQINKEEWKYLSILPTITNNNSLEIAKKIQSNSILMANIIRNYRGLGLQKFCKSEGNIIAIRGDAIARYTLTPNRFLDESIFEKNSDKLTRYQVKRIITQNILSYTNYPVKRIVINASIADENFIPLDTVNNLIITNNNYQLEFIAAVLNSFLMSWFTYYFIFNQANFTIHFDESYTNKIPLPIINFTTPEGDRRQLVSQLIEKYKLQTGEVFKISNVYPTDVIHDFLAFLAQEMISLNQQKQTEISDFLNWLSREIGTEIDNLTNKTTLKNYLGNYQKQEDNLTFENLLDTLKKNRKKLKIDPSERKFQNLLAKEYEQSLNTLLPIKKELQYTDKLIDKIVYQLYGLTDEEIAIIES